MGYTHYWEVVDWNSDEWQTAWPQIIEDVPKIIEASGVEITGPRAEPNDDGDVMDEDEDEDEDDIESVTEPLIDIKEGICVNGIGNAGHEDFILKDGKWSFCKTSQKPYDDVVTTILLRCAVLAPNQFKPSSDGDWEEWGPARVLYSQLWPGEEPGQPWEDDPPVAALDDEELSETASSE
ncbi:hypothetical protein N7528_003156 [Penicillium herquei]|nr:hypothetical protein N7528_003156 [Penicillium herquei]